MAFPRGSKRTVCGLPVSPSNAFISASSLQNPSCTSPLETGAASPEPEEVDDSVNAYTSQIFMAALQQGNRIGISFYNADTRQLLVLDTWEDASEDFPTLQLLKYQEQPMIIYTSSKMDETFVAALEKTVSADERPEVKIVKSSVFAYEQARHRLAYLRISGMPPELNDKERMQVLSTMINMESDMQVRAAGGLLVILEQESLIYPLQNEEYDSKEIEVTEISELSLNGFLKVDATTHDALQIFQVDKHPSFMGIGRAKEGFSVFGMLNKCVTMVGRRLMRLWFLRPILDLEVVNDRLDTISFLLAMPDLTFALQSALKRVKDIPRLLKKFSSPSSLSTSKDWLKFVELGMKQDTMQYLKHQSVSSLLQIRKMLTVTLSQRQTDQVAALRLRIVSKVVQSQDGDLGQVLELINGVIDFEESLGEACDTMIRRGISQELDELKEAFEGLPDFLNQVADAEIGRLQSQAQQPGEACIVYIPQVGYLMHFTKAKLSQHTLEKLPDFEFAFEGGEDHDRRFFYHTSKTRQLDDMLGDIYHKILDMEHAILETLQAKVAGFAPSLNEATGVAAELDCLLALAISAAEYKCVRPQLSEDNILVIKSGRHLLQELTVDRFVPNETVVEDGEDTGRIHVITGPNCSGKSIYLKQVGIIVFLAHIGSFVPADEAVVGLTDRIFSRVAGKETVRISRSAFMIDLHQISVMLRHATSRSLCLLDEFGKGTLTTDGIGLLCATLKYFASYELPPKVFATTHFSEVYDAGILPKSESISFFTMGIVEPVPSPVNALSDGDVVFLYRILPGHATPSYGLHCAEIAGVGHEILHRAGEVVQLLRECRPIERLKNARTDFQDQLYKDLGQKLLAFDAETGDVTAFLNDIFSVSNQTQPPT